MKVLNGKKVAGQVEKIIHEGKQVKKWTLDLSVDEIHEIKEKGSLDFGESEYTKADTEKIEPIKENEDDDYGWWKLEEGVYLIRFNEEIQEIKGLGLLSPHPRLIMAGGHHPTLNLLEWEEDFVLPLTVGKKGLDIKENARISKLMILVDK